jgi:predicted CXXCH cytochrome family protein
MCLSCHDGLSSIAVGSVSGSPPQTLLTTPGSGTGSVTWNSGGGFDKLGDFYDGWMNPLGPNIGNIVPDEVTGENTTDPIDLSDDHPVAFDWVDNIPGIKDSSNIFSANGLRLFAGRMECSTCHNVHDNTTYKPFLRMSNDGSAMCLKCHDK